MAPMLHASLLVAAGAGNVHDEARAEMAARPGVTWTAGVVGRFRGAPLGSSKDMLGVKEDQAEVFAKAVEDGIMELVTGGAINAPDSGLEYSRETSRYAYKTRFS